MEMQSEGQLHARTWSAKSLRLTAAIQRVELYYMAHPGSPSAVRRPRLLLRGRLWIALLRPSISEGIAGFGLTVDAALRNFDVQYLRALRPPEVFTKKQRRPAQDDSVGAPDRKRTHHRSSRTAWQERNC